jgi:hypothetical protein
MLMVIFMKDSGSMIKLMDMELTSMQMEQLMLVNGLKISSMEKAENHGQIQQNTKETM